MKDKGKWPAKEDLNVWYGKDNQRWKKNGQFNRCITMPNDSELLTRHEVFENPPDILVTNYSMLEYMLMRPIERPIFDKTRKWLEENPNERLLLVVDEAHLYRGAAGAEVALLLRRLRARLGIKKERIQVICTSASFRDKESAKKFSADLTGKEPTNFEIITGDLDLKKNAGIGNSEDVDLLRKIDLKKFYDAEDEEKLKYIKEFLEYRKVDSGNSIHLDLYKALKDYKPLSKLINISMESAIPINSLSEKIFPGIQNADKAMTNLVALASFAKKDLLSSSLLPCRVHAFFRGLAGLWACLNLNCTEISDSNGDKPTGKLYTQPRDTCHCGSKVYELYTCRNCGTAYARGWANKEEEIIPKFLWNERGTLIKTEQGPILDLEPIDILLENPSDIGQSSPLKIELDMLTGKCNPKNRGDKIRSVYIQPREGVEEAENRSRGQFYPCAVCDKKSSYGRSTVQNHQTSGDQPFQVLVTKQIAVQPPGLQKANRFAPLRGRKVLIFSDSRQIAARLAPNLKSLSMKDVLRPLLIKGFHKLNQLGKKIEDENIITLELCYLAILLASNEVKVRLHPETRNNETPYFEHEEKIKHWCDYDVDFNNNEKTKRMIRSFNSQKPPASLLNGIYDVLFANYYGVEDLALGSIIELPCLTDELSKELPILIGLADSKEEKIAVFRSWIKEWAKSNKIWLNICPDDWKEDLSDRSNRYIKTRNQVVSATLLKVF